MKREINHGVFIMVLLPLVSVLSIEGSNEFLITTDPGSQHDPAIYGNYVVWRDKRNGNWDIYGYNLATGQEFPITTDPYWQSNPAIYKDMVVWVSRGDYIGFTVHGVNISTGETFQVPKIRQSLFRPLYLQGDPAVFEDVVIWVEAGKDTIYGYNRLTKEKVKIAAAHEREQGPGTYRVNTTPAIYEDIVVWEDNRNGNYDIYGYNLTTGQEFQVTTHEANQHSSAIYEHIVVWQDIRNGNYDIYGCTITALLMTPEPNSVISLEILCGVIGILVVIIAVLIKKRS